MSMQVSDLMSNDVLTISAQSTVEQAASEMRLARVRHLPVVDPAGALTGMLSSLDLARSLSQGSTQKVADVMSVRVVVIREEAPASQAARLMRLRKIGSLPVVDGVGRLVGLITETDFLETAERALSGKPLQPRR
jgi:acetoin utilization protein AcuB